MKIILGMSNLNKLPLRDDRRSKGARLTAAMARRSQQQEDEARKSSEDEDVARALHLARAKLKGKLAFTLHSPTRQDALALAKAAAAGRVLKVRA